MCKFITGSTHRPASAHCTTNTEGMGKPQVPYCCQSSGLLTCHCRHACPSAHVPLKARAVFQRISRFANPEMPTTGSPDQCWLCRSVC